MAEPAEPYLVVGLGASAGGIAVLKEFFRHVPATTGNAYGVILHLSPQHESLLSKILQTVAAIPVRQVTGLAIVRNLVQLHDGAVTVHSDGLGTGSTFCVELPVDESEIVQRRDVEREGE